MKFSKILSGLLEETLPDWQDKFLSYKKLKKELKLIYPTEGDKPQKRPRLEGPDTTDGGDCGCSKEVDEEAEQVDQFVRLLRVEINKFNFFFLGKEEDYVIRWKELQDRVAKAKDSNEELMKVGREIVDFHGEMVLLENYSALNYTGLVKILKKYDKRSGSLIRLPFIQKLLQEPFYTTDVLDKLIKECESMLDRIFFINKPPASAYKPTDDDGGCDSKTSTENREGHPPTVPSELAEIENMKSMYTKLTLKALCVLKEIRSGSSTVNMFSLPPMQSATLEDDWKNVSVLEQAAK